MRYHLHEHRHGEALLRGEEHREVFEGLLRAIESISDEDIRAKHLSYKKPGMSLSRAINALLKERFIADGWHPESKIFQDKDYKDKTWRLDFAKEPISVEVGFNHGEAIAWNLLKPVLGSEMNHVKKAIQTKIGIFISASKELKTAGCFDNAVGEYEKVIRYLVPLNTYLTVPLVIIGLRAPESFKMVKEKNEKGRHKGRIVDLA